MPDQEESGQLRAEAAPTRVRVRRRAAAPADTVAASEDPVAPTEVRPRATRTRKASSATVATPSEAPSVTVPAAPTRRLTRAVKPVSEAPDAPPVLEPTTSTAAAPATDGVVVSAPLTAATAPDLAVGAPAARASRPRRRREPTAPPEVELSAIAESAPTAPEVVAASPARRRRRAVAPPADSSDTAVAEARSGAPTMLPTQAAPDGAQSPPEVQPSPSVDSQATTMARPPSESFGSRPSRRARRRARAAAAVAAAAAAAPASATAQPSAPSDSRPHTERPRRHQSFDRRQGSRDEQQPSRAPRPARTYGQPGDPQRQGGNWYARNRPGNQADREFGDPDRQRRGPIVDPRRRPGPGEMPAAAGRAPRGGQATGKISELARDRGFGFLVDGAGRKRFFHRSAVLANGFDTLREGQSVQFEPRDDVKGLRAVNVRPAGAANVRSAARPGQYDRSGARHTDPNARRTGQPPRRSADGGPAPLSAWRSSLSPFRGDPPSAGPRRRR
jgi:cold shock CspA family protein